MRIINRKKGQEFKISNEIIATLIDSEWHSSVMIIRCPPGRKLYFNNGEGIPPRLIPAYKPFTLRKGESIWIDDEIAVFMCVTSPSFSTIGVDAPEHITLLGEEAYDINHPMNKGATA